MRKFFSLSQCFLILGLFLNFASLAESKFDGAYIGAHLGYIKGDHDEMEAYNGAAPHWWVDNINPKGINLGIYTGFNKIFTNNFLLGIEANIEDINASNKKNGHFAGNVDDGYPVKVSYDYAASLKARLGYIFNQDSTMLFLTTGGALAKIKTDFYNENGNIVTDSNNHLYSGWTAGFGLEHAITQSISFKAEYVHTDLGSHTMHNTVYCGSPDCYEKITAEYDSIKTGLHYRF